MLAVVAGAVAVVVVVADAAAENGADLPEVADEANSGFPGNYSSPFSRSCRSLAATWYSSCSRCPCPFASCSNSAVAGRELALESTPAD